MGADFSFWLPVPFLHGTLGHLPLSLFLSILLLLLPLDDPQRNGPYLLVNAFDGSSREMPLDPNNGIRSAFVNDPPVHIKPMFHEHSEYEKMPYEYWHEQKPFAHVHGTEPEQPTLRHQHFRSNYYENFNSFITDPPGTGLNVEQSPQQPPLPLQFASRTTRQPSLGPPGDQENVEDQQQLLFGSRTTRQPLSSSSSAGPPAPIGPTESGQQLLPTVVEPTFPRPLPIDWIDPPTPIGRPTNGQTNPPRELHFPPSQNKLVNEVPPNTSAANEDEDDAKSVDSGLLPWLNSNLRRPPSKDFDAYEDIPSGDLKANSLPAKVAPWPRRPAPVGNTKPPSITLPPPRLIPFNPFAMAQLTKKQVQQLKRKKLIESGFIVSREQENPPKTKGQTSAIVIGDSYAGKKNPVPESASSYKGTSSLPNGAYQIVGSPVNYPSGGPIGASSPSFSNGCCCPSPSCGGGGGGCHPSQSVAAYPTRGPSCCCCGGGNINCAGECRGFGSCNGGRGGGGGGGGNGCCCCQGGGGGAFCRLRLIINCGGGCSPQQRPCVGRHRLLTNRTRVMFMNRRVRRSKTKKAMR